MNISKSTGILLFLQDFNSSNSLLSYIECLKKDLFCYEIEKVLHRVLLTGEDCILRKFFQVLEIDSRYQTEPPALKVRSSFSSLTCKIEAKLRKKNERMPYNLG